MKKLIALAFALSCGALMAEDQYLMWMLDDTIKLDEGTYELTGDTVAKIRVGADGSEQYLSLYGNPGEDAIGRQFGAQDSQGLPLYAGVGDFKTTPDTAFFLELWNDGAWVGQSELGTYSGLLQNIAAMQFDIGGSQVNPTTKLVSNFTAAPEPTSGLLLLLGVAGLALRRKNKKA